MAETPQRHTHSGPGDGGQLNLIDIKGNNEAVATVVDEGTLTLGASATSLEGPVESPVDLGGDTLDVQVACTSNPSEDIQIVETLTDTSSSLAAIVYALEVDNSKDEYYIQFNSNASVSVDLKYKVLRY